MWAAGIAIVIILLWRRMWRQFFFKLKSVRKEEVYKAGKPVFNWFGNETWIPEDVEYPESLSDIVKIIKRNQGKKVRAIGSLHSWSRSAEIDGGIMVCMKNMTQILQVDNEDTENMSITVEAGIELYDLYQIMKQQDMAFVTLPNHGKFQVGGCISNCVHGTNSSYGSFCSMVLEIVLVTSSGDVLTLNRDAESEEERDMFESVIASIGNAGIIYSVKFSTVPFYNVIVHQKLLDYDFVMENMDRLAIDGRSRQLVFQHRLKMAFMKVQIPVEPQVCKAAPRPTFMDYFIELYNFKVCPKRYTNIPKLILARILTAPWLKPIHEKFSGDCLQVQEWYDGEIIVKSWKDRAVFNLEYAISAERTTETMRAINAIFEKYEERGYTRLHGYVVRPIGPDTHGFLSPAKGRKTSYFDVAYQEMDNELEKECFAELENMFIRKGGRATWSRMFRAEGEKVLSNYPEAEKYVECINKLDPQRMFSNSFSERFFDF